MIVLSEPVWVQWYNGLRVRLACRGPGFNCWQHVWKEYSPSHGWARASLGTQHVDFDELEAAAVLRQMERLAKRQARSLDHVYLVGSFRSTPAERVDR